MYSEFSRQIFEKYSDIKFHENPSSGSLVVPCGQTDRTNQIVAFRNFAKAPQKCATSRDTFCCVCFRDTVYSVSAQCIAPLGMESGAIRDEDITASSSFDSGNVGPQFGR